VGRVSQLVGNLLANALQHGAEGAPVSVSVDCEGGTARLEIANPGPAIPAEEIRRLFEPFQRSDGQGERAGIGLGLHIVRLIARAHGGDVAMTSSDAEGTAVTVTLPSGP
jgi:signal transduction histidine kinase